MEISISLLLILYLFFVILFAIFFVIHLYHMLRFAFWDAPGYVATFLYIILSAAALFVSLGFLLMVDWSATFTIFGGDFTSVPKI